MVLKKISAPYTNQKQITITVLHVVNPAHFILKESPSLNTSSEAKNFIEAEESMQKYYKCIEPSFFQMPLKDSIVVVFFERKFYRAKVISILSMSAGYLFKVYLLDYGKECSVQRECIYEIQKDFLIHPFQAVNFKLFGIEPISLVMSTVDLSMSYGPVTDWDPSAEIFINNLCKVMCNAYIEVKTYDEQCVYGNLFMSFADGLTKCINDELIANKFAHFNEACSEKTQKMDEKDVKSATAEKLPVSPLTSQVSTKEDSEIIDLTVTFIKPDVDNLSNKIHAISEQLNSSTASQSYLKETRVTPDKVARPSSSPVVSEKFDVNKTTPEKFALPISPPVASENNEINKTVHHQNLQKLLKLRKLKSNSNNLAQHSTPKTSPAKIEENGAITVGSLSPNRSNFERKVDISNDNISSSPEVSTPNNSIYVTENRNVTSVASSVSPYSSNISPQQENKSSDKIVFSNLSRLEKLKKLKEKKLSSCLQTPVKHNDLFQNAVPENVPCPTLLKDDSNLIIANARELESTPKSPELLPKKDILHEPSAPSLPSIQKKTVDFRKVKAFLKKTPLPHCSSPKESKKQSNYETVQEQSKKFIPDLSAVPVHSEQSSVEQSNNFMMCSSPKTNKESNSKHITKESFIQPSDKCSPTAANSCQKSLELNDSKNSDSSFEKLVASKQINPEILKSLNDSSDMDDLTSMALKKNVSFEDKDDVEESYVQSCIKLTNSFSEQSIDFTDKSLWEKQRVPALMLGDVSFGPILSIGKDTFNSSLLQVLKELKFYGPSCIQSVIWPSVIRSKCIIAVAPPHSGKTVGYVVPLVSQLFDIKPSKGCGPITIILCSSWRKVQAVYNLFQVFLGSSKINIVTLFADGGTFRHKLISLVNGCDILITIPFCLLQFFKNKALRFIRCVTLILDDGTNLFNHHKKELRDIFVNFINGVNEKRIPQIVLCAERWSNDFHLVYNNLMSKPVLFFTSFLESAIFAKIPIMDCVCEPEKKKQALLDAIKDSTKIVICATTIDDAADLHNFLRCEDVKTYFVNEEMEHYIADEVIKDWKSAKCLVTSHCLVVTDQALIRLNITKADCLIHFDVPHDSRLQFGNRFSCIAEHFKNNEANQKCLCHVFVTTSDHEYAPYLVEIIEGSGCKPSKELKEMSEKRNKVENTSPFLCHYMKSFGKCKQPRCGYRHEIDPVLDKPQAIPIEGDVQGLITQVIDASRYYMRIQKYLDPKSNELMSLSALYAEVGFQLKEFYSDVSEDMKVEVPVIGEKYVLLAENKLFYRIKVLEKVNPLSLTEFPKWKILYLDEGWIKCFEELKLYNISDKINLPPPLATEIYVCNVMTSDSSLDWNPQTTYLVSEMIEGKEIHGKIVLCLGETLWLNPIAIRAWLPGRNEVLNVLKLDQRLRDYGHAKENYKHLKLLYKACAGKVPIPYVIPTEVPNEAKTIEESSSVSHAFLDLDTWEDVYVSSVISPHQFYVQREKFVECLDELLNNINMQIENKVMNKSCAFYKGMQCIAPFYEDDRYYRAVITDVHFIDVQLYFVDFGDTGTSSKSNIYILPSDFLLLPFQAIECELAGIAAAHGGWTDSVNNTLYDLTRDEAGDMKILQLKAYSKSNSYDGGNHYVVELWHDEKSLAEQLLQAGLVISAELPVQSFNKCEVSNDLEEKVNETSDFKDRSEMNSDSDMHPEEKDAAALFCGVLSQMLLRENNNKPKTNVTITEVTSEDEKNVGKVKELHEVNANTASSPDSYKPLITWWDTPVQLNILINLKNVKVYHLDVNDEGFKFNTVLCGTEYSTIEKFYAKIKSIQAKTFKTEEGINIVAKKCTPFKWPRFTEEKKKFLHIKYDLIHIDDSDTEENSVAANIEDMSVENDLADEKEESSDDGYAEPWRQIAQFKDPFNPLQ